MRPMLLGASLWLSLLLLLGQVRAGRAQPRGRAETSPSPSVAGSTLISLRVVDIAEDRAYVEPGSEGGLRSGDEVLFGTNRFRVAEISRSSASIELGGKRLALGARGSARVPILRPEPVAEKLPEPARLSSFRGEWRRHRATPAADQTPKPIPLRARERSQNHLILTDSVYAVIPTDGKAHFVGNELRGRLHYEPHPLTPLALDLDLGLQAFLGSNFSSRPGAAARPVLRMREFTLSYGKRLDYRAVLGRQPAASSTVGQLDGIRLDVPLTSKLGLTAFGGTAPQPFNGMISDQVARFGAELIYRDLQSSWRPHLVLGAHASRFDNALDEKELHANFELFPEKNRIGGHAEISFFESDNPWRASSTELTSAGVDASFQIDVFRFGARAELRRPDRSRWLASLLPSEWLCWVDPAKFRGSCQPDNATYLWMLDSGARIGKFAVDLGGQSSYTRGTDATNFGGFVNLRWIDLVGRVHLDLGAMALSGSVVRTTALLLAPGLTLANGSADLSLRYRPAFVRYRADIEPTFQHSLGASFWTAPDENWDFSVDGEFMHAHEIQALAVQGVFGWRTGY